MMDIIIQSAVGFLSAVIGALGMGGGAVLLIYLTAAAGYPQMKAQGINLIFFVPIAVTALIIHTKNKLVDYKMALTAAFTGAAGVLAGFYIARAVGETMLSKAFAVVLLILGIKELVGDSLSKRLKK